VINPLIFQDLPFRNKTALQDVQGIHWFWHRALADKIRQLGFAYRTYPLADSVGPEWLIANQNEHAGAAFAIGIVGPPDLQSYDLDDPAQWASFWFLHAGDHRRLQLAAGVV
jgi:hypothetical protein